MRLFIFLAAIASLVLAYFLEPLMVLLNTTGYSVIVPSFGVIALGFLAIFNCWVLFFSRTYGAVRSTWALVGISVGLIGGLIGFDMLFTQDMSEIVELFLALLLFCLPITIATALVCDWFPWRVVRREAEA
ncbi:MAG TPA: hypothetical protein VEA92_01760 [Candidatus Paceibacterota bacterium]|nr:hypothetical protein [Candidatus Paceibacterota bacterium]